MGKNMRILVVDDDEFVRAVSLFILTGAGHDVTVTANGAAALQRLKSAQFDLVIADLEMPLLDGIGLYSAVLNDYPYLTDRFLFITGRLTPTNQVVLEGWNAKYILKPFSVKELLQRVGTFML